MVWLWGLPLRQSLSEADNTKISFCIFSNSWNNHLLSLLESRAPLNCYRNVVHLKEVVFPIWAKRSLKSIYFPFTLKKKKKIIITVVLSHWRRKRLVACEYSGYWTGFSAGQVGEWLGKHSPSPLPAQLTLISFGPIQSSLKMTGICVLPSTGSSWPHSVCIALSGFVTYSKNECNQILKVTKYTSALFLL